MFPVYSYQPNAVLKAYQDNLDILAPSSLLNFHCHQLVPVSFTSFPQTLTADSSLASAVQPLPLPDKQSCYSRHCTLCFYFILAALQDRSKCFGLAFKTLHKSFLTCLSTLTGHCFLPQVPRGATPLCLHILVGRTILLTSMG